MADRAQSEEGWLLKDKVKHQLHVGNSILSAAVVAATLLVAVRRPFCICPHLALFMKLVPSVFCL